MLRTYSTCSYPGYQDTTTYAALTERLSSERDNTEEKKDEKDSSSPPPLPEYETPPKTEAEAIFRVLDVKRQGFVTRKVKYVGATRSR